MAMWLGHGLLRPAATLCFAVPVGGVFRVISKQVNVAAAPELQNLPMSWGSRGLTRLPGPCLEAARVAVGWDRGLDRASRLGPPRAASLQHRVRLRVAVLRPTVTERFVCPSPGVDNDPIVPAGEEELLDSGSVGPPFNSRRRE